MSNNRKAMMPSYAFYKLPCENYYTRIVQTAGEPQRLYSYEALSGRRGFVFAPFAPSEECPILVITPSASSAGKGVEKVDIPAFKETCGQSSLSCELNGSRLGVVSEEQALYSRDFSVFHQHLLNDDFQKIVLSRNADVTVEGAQSPEQLFLKACQMYPRQFVCLVSTPVSGTWLMATPEMLAAGNGHDWHTVALAGTMREDMLPASSEVNGSSIPQGWSKKNIREQQLVATYVRETLRPFCDNVEEDGPRMIHAGGLVHLRSDFRFDLSDLKDVGNLIAALHPTPAVCGLPKSDAYSFILANEYCSRKYYSGFAGWLNPEEQTHLYVSLRCMQLFGDHCRLYAGGGLLSESVEQAEWEETEAKMETMKRLLRQ